MGRPLYIWDYDFTGLFLVFFQGVCRSKANEQEGSAAEGSGLVASLTVTRKARGFWAAVHHASRFLGVVTPSEEATAVGEGGEGDAKKKSEG